MNINKTLDRVTDFVLLPIIKTLVFVGEALGAFFLGLLDLWPLILLALIVVACVKVLSG